MQKLIHMRGYLKNASSLRHFPFWGAWGAKPWIQKQELFGRRAPRTRRFSLITSTRPGRPMLFINPPPHQLEFDISSFYYWKATYESRLMRCPYKNAWSCWHSKFLRCLRSQVMNSAKQVLPRGDQPSRTRWLRLMTPTRCEHLAGPCYQCAYNLSLYVIYH